MSPSRFFGLVILILLLFSSTAFRFKEPIERIERVGPTGAKVSYNLPASHPLQQTGSGWVSAHESGGMAYFLFQSPPRIERYDMRTETWLTSIPLIDTPTAFTVDADGLYISFGRRTSRFALDGSGEVHLHNTDSDVQSLFSMGQFLYIHYWGTLVSVNKVSGTLLGSTGTWYGLQGFSVAPSRGKAFARSTGMSPADIAQFILNSDGTFGGVSDSPYHGSYPNASKTFIFPSDARVADSAGIVYNTSDLTYSNSFGGTIDDIAFYGDLPILRRGNTLIAFSNTLLETGRYTPTDPSVKIFVANQAIYSFSIGDTRGVRVTKIPVNLLTPLQPGQPVNPNYLAYTPDSVVLGTGEIVYLLSRTQLSIFRWSIAERRYLETIPLADAPSYMAYSPISNRLYFAYAGGKMTQIKLNESISEQPFANLPQSPMGLATAGEYVFVADPTGAWGSHFTYGPDGNLISQKEWNYYSSEYIWNETNRKMYFFRDSMSPNDLIWEDIAANGTIGSQQDTPYHDSTGFIHPIRVAPDGSVVVLGSGRIFDALSLVRVNTLSNNIEDAAWGDGNLFTLHTFNSNAQVQKWGANYGLSGASQVPGTPIKLLSINEGMLIITNFYGVPRFLITDLALNKIFASATLSDLSTANNSPKFVGQTTNLQASLINAVGPLTFTWAFGDGQSGMGQQILHNYAAAGTYTAVVTANNPADILTATTRVTITQPPITGLVAANNSPTVIGQPTTLSATVTTSGDITYTWAFGDGAIGIGKIITHTYGATGTYTALVTASNVISTATATTTVTIINPSSTGPWYVSLTGNDTNDCLSLLTACKKITTAVNKASAGGTIIVTTGNYTENVTFSKNLTIQGVYPNTIVNGNAAGSVFVINPGKVVTLTNLMITNGYANMGGGINNSGVLILRNSQVISNGVINHGGGIYNSGGSVTINNSTISNNSALNGGGIMNDSGGLVTVNRSTISGNKRANGGAIMNTNGSRMTINNSTISDNYGATATIYAFSPLTLTNSTVDKNGDFGIDAWATTVKLANTIVTNSANNECLTVAGGMIISLDYNLASDDSCNLFGPHDQPNTNPLLGPLANNGGDTLTRALLSGSPAIDAIPLSSCLNADGNPETSDQRGQVRPWDGNGDGNATCDIGAYEATGNEASAVLGVSPAILNFNATQGGSNPVAQAFSVNGFGTELLNWTANETLPWLSLSQTAGTTPATVDVSLNTAGLVAGTYTGQIIVSSEGVSNSPQIVTVTLNLNPAAPSTLNLNAEAGNASIKLTWNPINDPNVTTYRIARAVLSGTFTTIATVNNTIYFDSDPALVAGTTYCYRVAALRANNSVAATSNTACTTFGQVALWIPDIWAVPGQTAIVPVNIRNATGLRIAASDIWLDFDPAVLEPLNIQATALSAGYQWAYSMSNFSGYSRVKISVIAGSSPVLQGDGSLFWLTVRAVGASGDQTPLNLREFITGVGGSTIYTPADLFNPIPLSLQDGTFRVSNAYILGDLNGNGVIEAVDAYITLQIASHRLTPTSQQLQAGDVNGNGQIDTGDASMIFYYAVHGAWPPLPVGGSSLQAAAGSILLDLDDVHGQPGEVIVTTLRAQNLSGFAGGKFVIAYDPTLIESITNVVTTGLGAGFPVQFHDTGAGLLYIAMADDMPVSGSGALVAITLRINPNATLGLSTPLTLAEAYLNDVAGRDFATSVLQQTIIRSGGQITVGANSSSQIYLPIIRK